MESIIPRRIQLDKCIPAELIISKAIDEVEKLGADIILTNAIIKLSEARDLVSDYYDKTNCKSYTIEALKVLNTCRHTACPNPNKCGETGRCSGYPEYEL